MKTIIIAILALCTFVNAENQENADSIARDAIKMSARYCNGRLDSPEGRSQNVINNADFSLKLYMLRDEVPEKIRIAYALPILRSQLSGGILKRTSIRGVVEIDDIETKKIREKIQLQIRILEERLVAISDRSQAESGPRD